MQEKQGPQTEEISFRERVKSMWLYEIAAHRNGEKPPLVHGDWEELEFEFLSFEGDRFQYLQLIHTTDFEELIDWRSKMFWEEEMPRYNSESLTVEIHNLDALSKAIDFAHVMKESIQQQLQRDSAVFKSLSSMVKDLFYSSPEGLLPDSDYSYPQSRLVEESPVLKSEIRLWYRSIQIITAMHRWVKTYVPPWDDSIDYQESDWKVLIDDIYRLMEFDYTLDDESQKQASFIDPITKIDGYHIIEFAGEQLGPFTGLQAQVIQKLHEQYLDEKAQNSLKYDTIKRLVGNPSYTSMGKLARKNKTMFFKVVKKVSDGYYSLNVE